MFVREVAMVLLESRTGSLQGRCNWAILQSTWVNVEQWIN
jgi:hypothetical protein